MYRLARSIALLLVGGTAWAGGPAVLLMPPSNRSGNVVPEERLAEVIAAAFARQGYSILPDDELDTFLARHRIRYTGGVTGESATRMRVETGVEGAVVFSIDDWDGGDPPRLAVTARRVRADADVEITWCDGVALHGWDRPGAFGVGRVMDVQALLERAASTLARSMSAAETAAPTRRRGAPVDGRFAPASLAVDSGWAATPVSEGRPRIAVLPFVTEGVRREVGDVVALQFVRHLWAVSEGKVLEPAVVRDTLLEARVIQEGGPSLPQVDALRALLDVDLVVSGRVIAFEGSGSSPKSPYVGFSTRAIDAATRQVVWSSVSYAHGDDGLRLFGTGHVRSAVELTSELVRGVVQGVAKQVEHTRAARTEEPSP